MQVDVELLSGQPEKTKISPSLLGAPVKQNHRPDGTPKGVGFLGRLQRPDGRVSTEISIGVEIDGEEILIPTLVPTLNAEQVQRLLAIDLQKEEIPDDIRRMAVDFAMQRRKAGLPFFATHEESPGK